MDIEIHSGALDGTIAPPCSKSYAQRALAAALLCDGVTTLSNFGACDDTLSAMKCIETLGAEVSKIDDKRIKIKGSLAPRGNTLHIGESGLATRLFTPLASLWHERITITGHGSILKRPMTMMIEPLRELGVEVEANNGFLPITVKGPIKGGEVSVDGSVSSQFITGLLLSLPLAGEDTTLNVSSAVSTPYLDMTIAVAESFGVIISHTDYQQFFIEGGQTYRPTDYTIEGDWSAASALLVAGAIAGSVKLEHLSVLSKQADVAICDALVLAGAELVSQDGSVRVSRRELHPFTFDATQCPDLFPALVALAAAAEGETTLIGTTRLTHKESNRAITLQKEYAKVGIDIDLSQEDKMVVRGGKINSCRVDSHNDHRIAMSMAISALRGEGVMIIEGAECVAKSYPTFFEDIELLRAED